MSIPRKHETGWIYFLSARGSNAVKVGYTLHKDRRFAALQTGNHAQLVSLGSVEGPRELEAAIHTMLAGQCPRLEGEWFDNTHGHVTRMLDMLRLAQWTTDRPPLYVGMDDFLRYVQPLS